MNEQWTIHNLSNNGMRYGKFDSEDAATNAAREQGDLSRIDRDSCTVYFHGVVRL